MIVIYSRQEGLVLFVNVWLELLTPTITHVCSNQIVMDNSGQLNGEFRVKK